MTKLKWFLWWMLEDETSSAPAPEELAWRAACVRFAKWSAAAVVGAWAVYTYGFFAAQDAAQPFETLGTVTWVGDASSDRGASSYNGHASASHHVWEDGVHLQLDGITEPVVYTAGPTRGLRRLMVGERVRVKYRHGTWLFWEEMSVSDVAKLAEGFKPPWR